MTRPRARSSTGIPSLLILALTACGSPLGVRPVDPTKSSPFVERLRLSDEPSAATMQALHELSLDRALELTPEGVVKALEAEHERGNDRELLATQAEIAYLAGRELEELDGERAGGWFLLSAARSADYLFDLGYVGLERAFDSRYQQMVTLYRRAVGAYVIALKSGRGAFEPRTQETPMESFRIELESGSRRWYWGDFDFFVNAHELDIRGIGHRHTRDGIGTALVAVRENWGTDPVDRFFPQEGQIYPATAVLLFESHRGGTGSRNAWLSLYDPRHVESLSVGGLSVPVAADFTAPYAFLVERADLPSGWLDGDQAMRRLGLYLMEPYERRKIPVVMVHGLRSTPLAWAELTNDLVGDDQLRDSYQVWHFMYPSSLPYLFAGGLLRQALDDARSVFDPEGDDLASNEMVVVGHSMGGLLAKTLISDSGLDLWHVAFTAPPEQIVASVEAMEALRRTMIFAPKRYVRRVVFIATPHRGSDMADGFIGRLGSGLAGLPARYQELFRTVGEANKTALTPQMAPILRRGGTTSIRALSPRNPMLQTLAALPTAAGVPYHSIIGDRGRPDASPRSDGVVTYDSAHLPGAASEEVVPAPHAAYSHPETIAEIKRILRLHLEQR